MAGGGSVQHQKSGKADFGHIYDCEDPREYFNTLGGMGYRAPHHGQRIFARLLRERYGIDLLGERPANGKTNGNGGSHGPVRIADLCCSYGINGALLKYDTTLEELYERYGSEELAKLSSEEMAAADREFYASRLREDRPYTIGVDTAANAVSYARRSGALDFGAAENLESEEPGEELRTELAGLDLLTVTGGIGYIGERSFERVLDAVEGPAPWVAAVALRWVDYSDISETLARYGLKTRRLESQTFEQRRFADRDEKEYVCRELEKMDIDTTGKECEGSYHAYFYLSTPEEESIDVEELLGGDF